MTSLLDFTEGETFSLDIFEHMGQTAPISGQGGSRSRKLSRVNPGVTNSYPSYSTSLIGANGEYPAGTLNMRARSKEDLANKKPKTIKWSPEDDKRLRYAVQELGSGDWRAVSKFVGSGKTNSQCSQRWHRVINPEINKGQWTPEEVALLKQAVDKYGEKSWKQVSKAIRTRSDVQCRYHYFAILKKEEKTRVGSERPPKTAARVDDFRSEPVYNMNAVNHMFYAGRPHPWY